MAETLSVPAVTDEQATARQQLDLTGELGWEARDDIPQTPEQTTEELEAILSKELWDRMDRAHREDVSEGEAARVGKAIYTPGEYAVIQLPDGKRELVNVPMDKKRKGPGEAEQQFEPQTGDSLHYVIGIDSGNVYPTVKQGDLKFIREGGKAAANARELLEKGWHQSAELEKPKSELPESQESPDYKALEFDVKPLKPEVVEKPWLEGEVPSEQDWRRIDREAKAYFDNFEDPQDVVGLQQDLANYLKEVSNATRKQLSELGLEANSKIADQAVQQTVEAAKPKRITELVEQALPYSRKEGKDVNNSRESLTKLLNMGQEQFDQLMNDWRQHEMRELHAEALEEDKKFKVGKERKAARSEAEALDEKYGSVLAEISALPLDKEPGGLTHDTVDAYLGRQRKIESVNNELVDPAMLIEASQAQAVLDLQGQLRQKYQSEGLSEEQIQAKLAESAIALQTWVEHIDGNGIPLADLQRYENQGNKEKMLSAKRQKAGEYIGSVLLFRGIREALGREKSPEAQPDIEVGEILERGIDHSGSRDKAGAEVLANPDRAGSFLGRVMSQLETARTLSRNESTLMKSLIYMTAVEKSLGDGFVSAWEAIPAEKKKQARKKIMLGMAATSSALARMSAKAAAKARKTAATGATAGTIWLGNRGKG